MCAAEACCTCCMVNTAHCSKSGLYCPYSSLYHAAKGMLYQPKSALPHAAKGMLQLHWPYSSLYHAAESMLHRPKGSLREGHAALVLQLTRLSASVHGMVFLYGFESDTHCSIELMRKPPQMQSLTVSLSEFMAASAPSLSPAVIPSASSTRDPSWSHLMSGSEL